MKDVRRRRVLIVTSSYAPAMIADMHRARQLAWELPGLGWDVEILSPDSSYQRESCLDADSAAFFAPTIPVHSAPAALPRLFKAVGLGSIGWRVLWPMRRLGACLLGTGRFDLVYFSTTQFPLFLLGRGWKRDRGAPYVLDFHDPCYRSDRAPPVWAKRSLKHEASRRLAGFIESLSVLGASGLIAVSSTYIETLQRRYAARRASCLRPERNETIPFGVLPRDLEEAQRSMPRVGGVAGDSVRLVYVGAGGPIMKRSFALICRTLADLREVRSPALEGLRIELYGTTMGWQAGEEKHLAEVAGGFGVADLIYEDPRRVSYRRSLELLLESDGALILGVDDAGYMPSKLFTYAYSGKPLLASVRRRSPSFAAMRGIQPLGGTLWFDSDDEMPRSESAEVLLQIVEAARNRQCADRRHQLEPYVAATMARRHADLFERCLSGAGGESGSASFS